MGLEPQLTHYAVVFPLEGITNSMEDSKAWLRRAPKLWFPPCKVIQILWKIQKLG